MSVVTGSVSVKALRERFEQHGSKNPLLTPKEFAEMQKRLAENEAKAILEARRKAATYNMTVRALHLRNTNSATTSAASAKAAGAAEKGAASSNSSSSSSSSSSSASEKPKNGNATEKEKELNGVEQASNSAAASNVLKVSVLPSEATVSQTKVDSEFDTREMVRAKARRYSNALQLGSQKGNEVMEQKERRATQVLLQSLAQDLEKEIADEEETAKKMKEKEEAEASSAAAVASSQAKQTQEQVQAQEQEQVKAESDERDRMTLTTYLREHFPDRLGDVESLLKEYKGHLDVLFEELTRAGLEAEAKRVKAEKEAAAAASASSTATTAAVPKGSLDDSSSHIVTTDEKTKEDLTFLRSPPPSEAVSLSNSTPSTTTVSTTKKQKKFLDDAVSLDEMLTQFYTVYAPTKVPDVPAVMKHFDGRESDLIHTLELKYNVTFMTDGTCTPNDATAIGEPFIENSKFAFDVQKFTLRERLKQLGASPENVKAVLSSTSEMM